MSRVTLTYINRSHYSLLSSKPFGYSAIVSCFADMVTRQVTRKCIYTASNVYCKRCCRVSYLGFLVSPTTIIRLVISIVVNPIERVVLRWSLSHVCKKVGKPFLSQPAAADFYAARTVPFMRPVFNIVTTSLHSLIRLILRSIIHMAAMFKLWITRSRKCTTPITLTAPLASVILPARSVRPKLISTSASYRKAATSIQIILLGVSNHFKSAFPIHVTIVPQRSN